MFKAIRAIILVAAAVYIASLTYVLSFSLSKSIPDHADAVLILGAKVNLDNTPSEALYNRTMVAVQLYKEGKADYILTTGGVGLGYLPESKVAAKIALDSGVPEDKILAEAESHNTYDSLDDIKALADARHIRSIILVSDQYHVARGVLVAKHFGFDPVYWDYPKITYYEKSEIVWNYAREAAAIISYSPKLFGIR